MNPITLEVVHCVLGMAVSIGFQVLGVWLINYPSEDTQELTWDEQQRREVDRIITEK